VTQMFLVSVNDHNLLGENIKVTEKKIDNSLVGG